MILDKHNMFSEDQAITATADSTNVVDLGAAARRIAPGEPLKLVLRVTEAFNTLTSLTIGVQQDSVEAVSSPTVLQSVVVPLASLTLGARISMSFMPRNSERYLQLVYTVTGTNPTTGKITAGIALDEDDNEPYAGNI